MATATKATNKRDAVMNAALDLFVERGFYGTAVPEIADKAEVGAGTIYRYFPSKEALVNELYRQEKTAVRRQRDRGFPIGNARELFRALWCGWRSLPSRTRSRSCSSSSITTRAISMPRATRSRSG